MKNYYVGFCFLLVAAVSCRKVDDTSVFNQSVDQRLNAALDKYQAKLSGAQYGWKGLVETNEGGNFTFYFSFNDSNRVKMLSSFDSTSSTVLRESSYRLKALQQPSLLFDTYNYLHQLADPNPNSAGGEAGVGLGTDFEFYFDDTHSSTDTIALIGRFNGTHTTLVRATQAEQTAFVTGQLAGGLAIGKILNYYKRIIVNGTDSVDAFVETGNSYIISPDVLGNLLDDSRGTNYNLILGGIAFNTPFQVGTKTISQLTNINFDANTKTITATSNGEPVVIHGVVTPIKTDVNAPRRFYNLANNDPSYNYWSTYEGFHINGVDNAQGIDAIPTFYGFMTFWPEFGNASGVTYDYVSPVITNATGNPAVTYGPALRPPTFTADGRLVFGGFLANRGAASIPPAALPILTAIRTQFTIPQGYYFVQISSDPTAPAFHMVSAADGLAWITWIR